MKRRLILGTALLSLITAGTLIIERVSALELDSPAASLLTDDFEYAAGSLLTASGWTAHSGAGTNPLTVQPPSLTYAGYAGSGVGNAVPMTTSGEDAHRVFTAQTTGSVYAAVMLNVSDAFEDPAGIGGYVFHLGSDPFANTSFRGRVYVKKDAAGSLAFGISKSAATTSADIAFTPFSYARNATHLLIVKYTIVAGDTNDTADLFVNPSLGGAEPPPTGTAPDVTAGDINPGSVALRQGSAATAPTLVADGIRVGTAWADVAGGGGGGTPTPTATATATASPTPPLEHDAPYDFNGDGKTDYSVIRNTGGGANGQITWYSLFTGTTEFSATAWGTALDTIAPGDYDGDRKDDVAIWRSGNPGSAGFYILNSRDGTFSFVAFGVTNDEPVVTDYTGDGRDDPAIFREGLAPGQQSVFYFLASSGPGAGQVFASSWGTFGDTPIPGDFTGDGKADFCVVRPVSGSSVFFMHPGTGGPDVPGADTATFFGVANEFVVAGDYDGDRKTDYAVARPQSGSYFWYYLSSMTGQVVASVWGISSVDTRTPGDYDGDGRYDPAVWRRVAENNSYNFYVNASTAGPLSANWGLCTNVPIGNCDVPVAVEGVR